MEHINRIEIQGEVGGGIHINKSGDHIFAIIPVETVETINQDGTLIFQSTWHQVEALSSNDIPKVIFESIKKGITVNVKGKLKMKRYETGDGISYLLPYIAASKIEIIK